jgi:hypothetical protein
MVFSPDRWCGCLSRLNTDHRRDNLFVGTGFEQECAGIPPALWRKFLTDVFDMVVSETQANEEISLRRCAHLLQMREWVLSRKVEMGSGNAVTV